jgi:hypothetical protein
MYNIVKTGPSGRFFTYPGNMYTLWNASDGNAWAVSETSMNFWVHAAKIQKTAIFVNGLHFELYQGKRNFWHLLSQPPFLSIPWSSSNKVGQFIDTSRSHKAVKFQLWSY